MDEGSFNQVVRASLIKGQLESEQSGDSSVCEGDGPDEIGDRRLPWRTPREGKLGAQNSLELKLPSGSSPPFYTKQRTLSPEGKKWTFGLITPSSQPVPASGRSPEFLAPAVEEITNPNNLGEELGPLKTVDFHIYACMYLLFSWVSAAAKSLQSCPTLCDPKTAARQAPPSLVSQQLTKLPAAPSGLVKGDLFLQSASLVLSPNLDFSNFLTLH